MEFRIVPIALTWSMDDETVNRFFPCNLVFSDRLSVLWARLISDNLVECTSNSDFERVSGPENPYM
jgi:hypothetical protein